VNSRSLTYRSQDGELDIISPNSFLKLHCNSSLIFRTEDEDWVDNDSQERLIDTLKKQDEAFETFRRLWHENYLTSLREHSRNLYQTEWINKIKIDDIVLIRHPNKPRPFWLLGRILDTVVGHDNIIRSVRLKQGDGTIAHHSIKNLYPLELSLTHNPKFKNISSNSNDLGSENDNLPNDDLPDNDIPAIRPTRKAALKCRKFIQDNLDDF